jgi:bifunctional non-homologous end joining protein LigD
MSNAQLIDVGGRRLEVTDLGKVLYPATGFTKGDVIRYYRSVAPALLPHVVRRPLTLKRYPDGVDAPHFYEKRCPPRRPDWIEPIEMPSRRHGTVAYCAIDDVAGLVWLANPESLEIHPFLARAPRTSSDDPAGCPR